MLRAHVHGTDGYSQDKPPHEGACDESRMAESSGSLLPWAAMALASREMGRGD